MFINEMNFYFYENSYTSKILEEEGGGGFLRYLNSDQTYSIETVGTSWSFSPDCFFVGEVGHHALIRLPGNRICEWNNTRTSDDRKRTGKEIRVLKGKEIEDLWRTHLEMSPSYHALFGETHFLTKYLPVFFGKKGYIKYCPFKNDCFVYVNEVLKRNRQEKTMLRRVKTSNRLFPLVSFLGLIEKGGENTFRSKEEFVASIVCCVTLSYFLKPVEGNKIFTDNSCSIERD